MVESYTLKKKKILKSKTINYFSTLSDLLLIFHHLNTNIKHHSLDSHGFF